MRQYNPKLKGIWNAKRKVMHIELQKYKKKRNLYTYKAKHHMATPFKRCSQCNGWMRGDIAKIQIENKRKNAPICFACCMGYKRKQKIS